MTWHWLALLGAGIFEVLGVVGFARVSRGRALAGGLLMTLGFGTALGFLALAMRGIDLGIAYAVFTGIGTVCGTLLGMLYWGESRHPLRIAFTALIVLGVVGLKLLA
ncbi:MULTISPECIES: DMT family transporter [Chromohalobacter]|jgi:paired small multidrug resistance pump|uniref:Guanidinium exporter n=1 Tax=Chromohalobacter israelensis (strain ATCC BAA-138 / DSM 3043 / CIP 106854 / NCIMB 13768 / 1H11) TaxID=290398 RepID=Q1R1D6_CHRI1|nr:MULTISPECIES: SMR family transporter [Chromohalobacter]ABE57472.1 small multidrug resistance protein [Chromohalobacter salexigens DSM 3043]MBZ5876415.1 QacE family quaternary ammonium compound efflux SMR transporter [Chromohalobacter salexigens]MDF9435001.1 SMR family transporter [Chromohalobacter israelensis]NQY45496.1 QacE family quaternary ammonium compound efflux SMR transporter [Chromohalobacter sp.]NWO55424.1 QacE family quaternary ammonium compound efflux SMR transporter [Chromohalob